MIVVSDTSPIRYLIEIDAVDVLRALFGTIAVPPAVLKELQLPAFPAKVRDWSATLPNWVTLKVPSSPFPPEDRIHPGEAEAIGLALETKADRLLLDDQFAVRRARELGLMTIGTLTVIAVASELNLIPLANSLDRLAGETMFRATPALLERFMKQDDALRELILRERAAIEASKQGQRHEE